MFSLLNAYAAPAAEKETPGTEYTLLGIFVCVALTGYYSSELTLGNLSSQRRRNGDKVQVSGAIVDRHLSALAKVISIGIALSHEQIQRKIPVHQHSCSRPCYKTSKSGEDSAKVEELS